MAADRITLLFTRRRFNPVSWLIRWAVPRSRFAFGLSSHCIVDAGDKMYEAHMLHGVRQVDRATALKGQTIVKATHYQVPDAAAGLEWAAGQIGKSYDWPGALGLGLTPGRDWGQDDKWFCYEFAAAVLRAAGRDVFENLTHIGETALMAINP
jgi:uncharacterized protein YycO